MDSKSLLNIIRCIYDISIPINFMYSHVQVPIVFGVMVDPVNLERYAEGHPCLGGKEEPGMTNTACRNKPGGET